MTSATNLLEGVVVGEYGETVLMTLVDADGVAVNVSAYNGTKTVHFRSPDDRKMFSLTVSFQTTGADGKVTFTFASGQIDRAGDWKGQFKLQNTPLTKEARSKVFTMAVEQGLVES